MNKFKARTVSYNHTVMVGEYLEFFKDELDNSLVDTFKEFIPTKLSQLERTYGFFRIKDGYYHSSFNIQPVERQKITNFELKNITLSPEGEDGYLGLQLECILLLTLDPESDADFDARVKDQETKKQKRIADLKAELANLDSDFDAKINSLKNKKQKQIDGRRTQLANLEKE